MISLHRQEVIGCLFVSNSWYGRAGDLHWGLRCQTKFAPPHTTQLCISVPLREPCLCKYTCEMSGHYKENMQMLVLLGRLTTSFQTFTWTSTWGCPDMAGVFLVGMWNISCPVGTYQMPFYPFLWLAESHSGNIFLPSSVSEWYDMLHYY